MMLSRAPLTVAVSLAMLVSGGAANLRTERSRFGIAADDVVAAVREKGVSVVPGQVSFLAAIAASQASPRLHIAGSRKLGEQETAVRFACESNAICLPFYVVVRDLDDEQKRLLLKAVATAAKSPARAERPCIRNGDRASLVMEGAQMRITVQVIALQSGRVGETIRATDTERKKIYRAEVSGPGLLKSAL